MCSGRTHHHFGAAASGAPCVSRTTQPVSNNPAQSTDAYAEGPLSMGETHTINTQPRGHCRSQAQYMRAGNLHRANIAQIVSQIVSHIRDRMCAQPHNLCRSLPNVNWPQPWAVRQAVWLIMQVMVSGWSAPSTRMWSASAWRYMGSASAYLPWLKIFTGLRRHGFEPANSPFWSGAGRLRKVSVFNPQTKLYNTLTSVVLAQAFTDAVTNYNDRMSCCPYLTGSGLKVMDLDAASGALEKARRHFVDALLVNLSEAALESVGKINRRQLGIRGDLVLTGRTGNTATFFEPVVLQGNAPVPPIDGVCMGFTGKKIRCTHPATRAFRVISTRYHDGQGTMVPINPSYVLHVCGNHGRVGGFLERMGDAVVPM